MFASAGGAEGHRFAIRGGDFVLDGRPIRIMAGELHFQRIPREYWRDRLLKCRAMGLNTIATYLFWDLFEPEPGRWDFTGRNDVAAFIREAQAAGLWVILRPGPYSCAEFDFGGLPTWLLRTPDIRIRCSDPRYLAACESYIGRIASQLRNLTAERGGPILMVQIENEYGSYGNDREYLEFLRRAWEASDVHGPFFTADGAEPDMLEAGTLPGAAIGLDPATNARDFAEAAKLGRDVPVFCTELYPGWITHWGEPWAQIKDDDVMPKLTWLLENGKSVQPLRRPRRHELRLHGRRQLRRQGTSRPSRATTTTPRSTRWASRPPATSSCAPCWPSTSPRERRSPISRPRFP